MSALTYYGLGLISLVRIKAGNLSTAQTKAEAGDENVITDDVSISVTS